jgi:hypothetical protein
MKRALLALSLTVALTGCAIDETPAPSLTGPSELGLSVALTASPDTLLMNGTAQSTVSVVVRNNNGQLVPGQVFYVQTRVGSTVNGFGTLSASSITTDSQGRAAVLFTAPPPDAGNISTISVEFLPVGSTSAADNSARLVLIKMVRP